MSIAQSHSNIILIYIYLSNLSSSHARESHLTRTEYESRSESIIQVNFTHISQFISIEYDSYFEDIIQDFISLFIFIKYQS